MHKPRELVSARRRRGQFLSDHTGSGESAICPCPGREHLGGPDIVSGCVPHARCCEDQHFQRAGPPGWGKAVSRYFLDANVFIQAKNLHYGFDFCPAFWDWLLDRNAASKVASIDRVRDELVAGDDALAAWAQERDEGFFRGPDNAVLQVLREVSSWAYSQGYDLAAVTTFLQVADYWLVAYAKAHDYTLVTHEVSDNSRRKIKIPEACSGLGISCINPFEMLSREQAQFVLG